MTEKFVFDTVFDRSGEIVQERPRPKKHFTPEEVDAARAEAHAAGRAEAEGEIAAAVQALSGQMATLLGALIEERTTLRAEAVELAAAVSKKLSGKLIEMAPLEAVMGLLENTIEHLRDAPRIVIRVSPDLVAPLQERLNGLLTQLGFEGHLLVLPDEELHAANCKIDWAKGGLEHETDASVAIVDKAIQDFLISARLADEMVEQTNTAVGQQG